ncbi:MAG: hypothetical protein JWR74_1850 [Polaromonas sp.]|nr:hypothetical protein [Polaromonas sp.]
MHPAQLVFTSVEIIDQIIALAPFGHVATPAVQQQLRAATQTLISLFKAEGRLDQNPSALAMNRTVDLHREAATARLEGRRVLVTGGAGCVGSRLIPLIGSLGAAEIAIVDIAQPSAKSDELANVQGLKTYQVDIRNTDALDGVFAEFKPEIVFHLAGIREPGRAESVVRDAIETNVYGTGHVIAACLKHGVKDAVYSSTGKCFAYISDHVYTASKKLAEAQWVVAARNSDTTRFRCTRFTHIMENGLVAHDIVQGIANGLVGLHGPDRYFNIQNLRQATHLLVNALALAEQTPSDGFWAAVDLGWPVNTLELALYSIDRDDSKAAVCFLGVPKGYDEAFFRGQFPWDGEAHYHPLVNALEAPSAFEDSTGTMVGARIQAFSEAALGMELHKLQEKLRDTTDMAGMKSALASAVAGFTQSVFNEADLTRLIDVLWSGAAPAWAGHGASEAERFWLLISLLTDAVIARAMLSPNDFTAENRQKLVEVSRTLAKINKLSLQAKSLAALLAYEIPDHLQDLPSANDAQLALKSH